MLRTAIIRRDLGTATGVPAYMGLPHRAGVWASFASVALLALGGCNWISGTGSRHGDFRGIYVTAFEASAFRECRGREYWWLSGELGSIFEILPPEGPPAWSRAAYVHVRGARSKRGRYGHAGGSPYELVVSEVLDVSVDTAGQCRG